VTQLRVPESVYDPQSPSPLGVNASATHEALQADCYKELINKLAWAIGSTFRTPFSNSRTPTRQLARKLASTLIVEHGYPERIAR